MSDNIKDVDVRNFCALNERGVKPDIHKEVQENPVWGDLDNLCKMANAAADTHGDIFLTLLMEQLAYELSMRMIGEIVNREIE